MLDVWNDQCPYGKLQLAINGDIEWFALAPEATLTDIADMFRQKAGSVPRRLMSVRVTIESAPRHIVGDQ